MAGRTRLGGRHRERHLGSVHRLVEGERDLGLHVTSAFLGASPPWPAARATGAGGSRPTEEVGQDVAKATGERGRVKSSRSTGERPKRTRSAVIVLAFLRIGKNVVGLGDLLEAL